jgi:hypothetical protein
MKRLLTLCLILGAARVAPAQVNLLTNPGFETAPNIYYDGFDPSVADDEPGWIAFLGAADGSYVLTSAEADPLAGGTDLDMGIGPAGGGVQTAPGSRPAVTPLLPYRATVTQDNYFAPSGAAFFIDWFDGGGSLLSSSGGPLGDPNGGLTYAPYTQLFTINASAPAGAASAGVRFEAGNAAYAGMAADNFTLSQIPEPSSVVLLAGALGALGLTARRRR